MCVCPRSQGWPGLCAQNHRLFVRAGRALSNIYSQPASLSPAEETDIPERLSDLPKVTQSVEGQDWKRGLLLLVAHVL